MKLLKEVEQIAMSLQRWAHENNEHLSLVEALQIAALIQKNMLLSKAFMLDGDSPSALEAIAMELGAAKSGSTIKDAIYSLK